MSSYDQNEPVSPSSTGGADAKATLDSFIGASEAYAKPVRSARFIIPINTIRDCAANASSVACRDKARFTSFLADSHTDGNGVTHFVNKLITVGVTPDPYGRVDSATYKGCDLAPFNAAGSPNFCSNGKQGGTGIVALRAYLLAVPHNGVVTWGAANEPNFARNSASPSDPLVPGDAARFFKDWMQYCSTCKVVVGELGEIDTYNDYSSKFIEAQHNIEAGLSGGQKPVAYGVHTYANGTAPSADNGRMLELIQNYRNFYDYNPNVAPGQVPIWCTECGSRIDVDGVGPTHLDPNTPCINGQPNRVPSSSHTVGRYGTEMFPQDYSNSEQDRAYTEQVTSGLLLGQAANDPNGPTRMYFSEPEALVNRAADCAGNLTVGTFDSSAFVRINEYYGVNGTPLPSNPAPPLPPDGNRARPAYCGYIYSGYDAASICGGLKPNVYPSDGRFPGK